jgi:uncharacterized protein YjbI with pentapeptide repeats
MRWLVKLFADESLAVGWRVVKKNPPQTSATVIAKAVLKLNPGQCTLLPIEGVTLNGDVAFEDGGPEKANRYESDFAPFKPRADVLLVGTIHAPGKTPVPRLQARLRAGNLSKAIDVLGRREWKNRLLGTKTEPEPFVTLPLRYERAMGGPKSKYNPIGASGDVLPNFELNTKGSSRDTLIPAGFSPISAAWLPRAGLLGTYDNAYVKNRWPWFPVDFDWGYFNAAPRDQQVEGYLRGDEILEFENLHPDLPLYATRLPGVRARWFVNERFGNELRFREVPLALDTLWIDMDNERAVLVWRGLTDVQSMRLKEIVETLVVLEPMNEAPNNLEFFRNELTSRIKADEVANEGPEDAEDAQAEEEFQRVAAEVEAARAKTAPPPPPGPSPLVEDIAGLEAAIAAMAPTDPELPKAKALLAELIGIRNDERAAIALTRADVERLANEKASFAGKTLDDLDLSGLDLSGLDFTEALLTKAKLTNANLAQANLTEALLFGADLSGANLNGAILNGAMLDEARLAKASVAQISLIEASLSKLDLVGIDLSGCQAQGADFSGSNFAGARFVAANLEQANFADCNLEGADMSKASLQSAVFDAVKARGIKMEEANLTGMQAGEGADFTEGRFQRVQGPGAIFEDCILDRADFSGAILTRSQFASASMREVKCHRVDFTKTDFSDAVLVRAVLTNCNLLRTMFDRADLTKADVRDSNCYEAGFWDAVTKDANWRGANLTSTLLG